MAKLRTIPMADQAYDYLYQKIISCDYMPGQRISEKQLLEDTGFSRTPLREALLSLQKEHLIEIFPRKGMRIAPFTEKGIRDLFQTRKIIEPTVLSEYRTLHDKNRLLEFQKKFEESEYLDDFNEFCLDSQFHSYLVDVTENQLLTDIFHQIMVQQTRLAMFAAVQKQKNREGNLEQHKRIIDALLRENEKDVHDSIIMHINCSLVRALNALYHAQNKDASPLP